MARDTNLEDLCTNLLEALRSVAKADELPPYLQAKARDFNALGSHENLKKSIPEDGMQRLYDSKNKARVTIDLDISTKQELIAELIRMKPALDRVKDSSFRLMVERLESVYDLAVYLSELTDEILIKEAELASQVGKEFTVKVHR